MYIRDYYDISPKDAKKEAEIHRHTADLAILDFQAGTPFFWDNEGIAFKRMVSMKTGRYFQQNTIPMIYACKERGYTDCRWAKMEIMKDLHIYNQDDGIELPMYSNDEAFKEKDKNGNQILDRNGHPTEIMVKRAKPMVTIQKLYNGSAIKGIGIESSMPYNWMEKNEIKKRLLNNCESAIVFDQTENNFYAENTDTIHMIPEEKWKNKDEFLVELYHCISHSSLAKELASGKMGNLWI